MFSPEVVPINLINGGGFTMEVVAVAGQIATAHGEQHQVIVETILTEVYNTNLSSKL